MIAKSGVWRRTSGLTVAREDVVSAVERFEGLGRLVRQVMTVSLAPRGDGALGLPQSSQRSQRTAAVDGTAETGTDARCVAGGMDVSGNSEATDAGVAASVGIPAVVEWVAVKMDCDPVARVCAKLEIAQAQLSVLTKEYCGLSTREVCDAARVARVKPAVRARVIETALSCWGRPGLAAQLYCLQGGLLPRQQDELRAQRRGGGNGFGGGGGGGGSGSVYFRERTQATFAPLMDPGVAREDLVETLATQLMNAVDASRSLAEFDRDAWAVGLGFANYARLKRACVVVLGKSVRQMERELCADVVEYWLAVESDVVLKLARETRERPAVLRARWLFQGHEGPVAEAAMSRLEWLREVDPGGAWDVGLTIGSIDE